MKYIKVTFRLTSTDKLLHLKSNTFSIAMFNMKLRELHVLKHYYIIITAKYGVIFYYLCYLFYSLLLLYTRRSLSNCI